MASHYMIPLHTKHLQVVPIDHHIAKLAALGVNLALVDSMLPLPIPGIKSGIANIVVFTAFEQYGWRAACWVSLLRVFSVGIVFGSFLTPGFFLSLSGAMASLLSLWVTSRLPIRYFSAITHNVCAALCHYAGQLMLIYCYFSLPLVSLYVWVPFFMINAIVTGIANGILANHFFKLFPAFSMDKTNSS